MFVGPEIKDPGPVSGVRSFVEGLRGREWHGIGSYRSTIDRRYRRGSKFTELDNAETGP